MIKATFKFTPTAYTTAFTQTFNSIEDVLRHMAKNDNLCVISIEEENVGYHLVHLNDGKVYLKECTMVYECNGRINVGPSPKYSLKLHTSKNFDGAVKVVEAELKAPKLA